MSSLGFIPDTLFLGITFFLIIKFREKLTNLFFKININQFLLFILSSIPFMIVEENINCLPTGCVFIPWTIPFLIIFVSILGFITIKSKTKNIKFPLIGFISFGVLWEVLIGGLRGQLNAIGIPFYLFMIFWVALSYAYLVIIPLKILLRNK